MVAAWILGVAALLGAVAGSLIGATGIGGVIIVPTLIQLPDIEVQGAVAAALFSYIAAGIAGPTAMYLQQRMAWADASWLALGAIPGAFGGSVAIEKISTVITKSVLYLVILITGLFTLHSLWLEKKRKRELEGDEDIGGHARPGSTDTAGRAAHSTAAGHVQEGAVNNLERATAARGVESAGSGVVESGRGGVEDTSDTLEMRGGDSAEAVRGGGWLRNEADVLEEGGRFAANVKESGKAMDGIPQEDQDMNGHTQRQEPTVVSGDVEAATDERGGRVGVGGGREVGGVTEEVASEVEEGERSRGSEDADGAASSGHLGEGRTEATEADGVGAEARAAESNTAVFIGAQLDRQSVGNSAADSREHEAQNNSEDNVKEGSQGDSLDDSQADLEDSDEESDDREESEVDDSRDIILVDDAVQVAETDLDIVEQGAQNAQPASTHSAARGERAAQQAQPPTRQEPDSESDSTATQDRWAVNTKRGRYQRLGIGLIVGAGSTLTGTSGPVLMLPIVLGMGWDVNVALSSALLIQLPIATAATISYVLLRPGLLDFALGGALAVTLGPFMFLGAHIGKKLELDTLKLVICIILIVVAVALLAQLGTSEIK